MRRAGLFAAAAALAFGFLSVPARADTCQVEPGKTKFIKIGTLAPKGSAWGEVFGVWSEAFTQRTHCAYALQFMWNGSKGDEITMVKAIRSGELDGAAVTALGLGEIDNNYLLFALPGLFSGWEALDRARDALKNKFDARFRERGFKLLGAGDIGRVRVLTAGVEVLRPTDLRVKGTVSLDGDPVTPALYQVIGGTAPKQTTITQVLPLLQSKTVSVVSVPALAAEQLQWAPYLDHIGTEAGAYAIGGLVFSTTYKDTKGGVHEGSLDKLPEDVRKLLAETGEKAGHALSLRVRSMDDQAFKRLASKLQTFTPSDAVKLEWAQVFQDTRQKLRGTTFSPELFDEVMKYADLASVASAALKAKP